MNSLDRYLQEHGDQEVVEEREPLVQENPRLEALVSAYEGWLSGPKFILAYSYGQALDAIVDLSYIASDVRDLSLRFVDYENDEDFFSSGIFLSALVNTGGEDRYEMVTEHLDTHLDWLGYHNVKELTVIGAAGDLAGFGMSGGSLTVRGAAGGYVGKYMSDGSLTIKGDAGDWAGDNMFGGSLTVNGDAGDDVGFEMSDGVLRVGGKIASISQYWKDGDIYEGGKLVKAKPLRRLKHFLRGGKR